MHTLHLIQACQIIEDHRGQTVYNKVDGSQLIIQELGQLPENVTVISPTGSFERWDGEKWQPSITDAKEAKYSAIKNQRDAITTDYIIINNHYFHSDTSSRIQQLSLTKMGAEKKIPPGLMWKTKNNGLIELTNEIAAQFESICACSQTPSTISRRWKHWTIFRRCSTTIIQQAGNHE